MTARRKPKDLRTRQLAAIHACKREAELDDGTYRDLLERVGGCRSAGDMDDAARWRVLDHFKTQGLKAAALMRNAVPAPPPGAPEVPAKCRAMIRKIGILLALRGKGWDYAHNTAKRMFHRDRLEWLSYSELHKVVAALQINANRHKKRGEARAQ